jgi:hypothetical protein
MTIRFDLESRHVVDDNTGEYLEHGFHHYQDPLHYYRARGPDGEALLSAQIAERRIDTTGDKTVDRVEAAVFRIFQSALRRQNGAGLVRLAPRSTPVHGVLQDALAQPANQLTERGNFFQAVVEAAAE